MPCGEINPNRKAINKKINKVNEIPIRNVNALTVRVVFPESLIRKKSPLANEPAIINMTKRMKILVIICYTPEIAFFSRKLANFLSN